MCLKAYSHNGEKKYMATCILLAGGLGSIYLERKLASLSVLTHQSLRCAGSIMCRSPSAAMLSHTHTLLFPASVISSTWCMKMSLSPHHSRWGCGIRRSIKTADSSAAFEMKNEISHLFEMDAHPPAFVDAMNGIDWPLPTDGSSPAV